MRNLFKLFCLFGLMLIFGLIYVVYYKYRKKTTFQQSFKHVLKSGTSLLKINSAQIPNFVIPQNKYWNKIRVELFNDFIIPTTYDPIVKKPMPNGGIIWHNIGRNQFSGVAEMFRKGIIAVHQTIPIEKDFPIPAEKLVVEAALGLGGPGVDDNVNNIYLQSQQKIIEGCVGMKLKADSNGQFNPFLVLTDYEGKHTQAFNQDDTDILKSLDEGQASVTTNYRSLMYLNPISAALGNVNAELLNGGYRSPSWFNPASSNAVASAVGKSMAGDEEVAAVLELSYFAETMKKENEIIYDQFGNEWFKVSHFGSEFSTTNTLNNSANTQNWATVVGGSVQEAHKECLATGQLLIAQLKDTCQVGNGYYFNPEIAQYVGGKYNQDFGRFANIQEIGQSTTGTETVTNFIAEGQVMLASFCGAKYINNWGSSFTQDLFPTLKTNGPRRGGRFDDFAYGNLDTEPLEHMMKGNYRLAEKCRKGFKRFSFYDICDKNIKYLNASTRGSWDGGKTFNQFTPLDWQVYQKTPMVAAVNPEKRVGFVMACQAYASEQDKLIFTFNQFGANVKINLTVPPNEIVCEMFTF